MVCDRVFLSKALKNRSQNKPFYMWQVSNVETEEESGELLAVISFAADLDELKTV